MNLETYISELSKYVIASILVLYAILCVICVLRKNEEKKKGFYIGQNILMFAFHFCSYVVICFESGEVSYLIFYAFQQIIFYVVIMVYKALYPKASRLIVNNICMLLSISCVILTRLDYSKALKQFLISCASLLIAIIIPYLIKKFNIFKNLKWVYAGIGILALGIVLILGSTTYGSKLSYSIAGITFQPSEFVKITFVFFVASALYKSTTVIEILISSIVAFLHVGIQVLNKDLGSAAIFFIVYVCMLYIATSKIRFLIIGLTLGAGAAFLAFELFSHVQNRVYAFLDPWSSIDSTGYQITQSLFAQSFGGWFGLGLYKGTPNSIPFVEDDFIFSALTEEFGVIFGMALIVICISIFVAILLNAVRIKNKFYQLISLGFGITYIFQVLLTIGGGTKFIPLTGVTLPLVSYGGSSVMSTIIMFAIFLGITIIHSDEAEMAEEQMQNSKQFHSRRPEKEIVYSDKMRDNRKSNVSTVRNNHRPHHRQNADNLQNYSRPITNNQYGNQQYYNQSYDNGQYDRRQYYNQSYDNGQYDNRQYYDQTYNAVQYDNQQYHDQTYDAVQYDNQQYYDQTYDGGQYGNQQYYDPTYDGGQYGNQQYYDQTYDGGQYGNQQYYDPTNDGGQYDNQKYYSDKEYTGQIEYTENLNVNKKVERYKPLDKEEISYIDDDMVFLHGFTTNIDADLINEIANDFSNDEDDITIADPEDFFTGEIYYSEEEYEKEKKAGFNK